jgi:AcrR family transcriptional regulator
VATASGKRLGTQKSATRAALIEAAEKLMLEEGFAAVTTRRLAETSGIKFQLIYYYFNTLEDLLLEVVARHVQRNAETIARAFAEGNPVRAVWRFQSSPQSGGGIIGELTVLAKQYPRVRAAIAADAEALRAKEVEAISTYLQARQIDVGLPALDLTMLLDSIARTLRMEGGYGMSLGHAELQARVEDWLKRIEAAPRGARVQLV